jgi:hypothetical protein
MRIKMHGGRIEPYRDENNEFIGPDRVWLKNQEIPGLAMSRSFGDRVAASVGCIATPGKKNLILLILFFLYILNVFNFAIFNSLCFLKNHF